MMQNILCTLSCRHQCEGCSRLLVCLPDGIKCAECSICRVAVPPASVSTSSRMVSRLPYLRARQGRKGIIGGGAQVIINHDNTLVLRPGCQPCTGSAASMPAHVKPGKHGLDHACCKAAFCAHVQQVLRKRAACTDAASPACLDIMPMHHQHAYGPIIRHPLHKWLLPIPCTELMSYTCVISAMIAGQVGKHLAALQC